jgi:glycosyltransferase involved in cell wall biosynthesis
MARILINGVSAKSGGGKSILRNLLIGLSQGGGAHHYDVLVPPGMGYEELATDRICIRPRDDVANLIELSHFSLFRLPRVLKAEGFDLLFNPSDIIVPTAVPQVFLFDWAYAAFPDSAAWRLGSLRDRLVRRAKLALFRRHVRHVDIMIAQTPPIADQLRRLYGLTDIEIVGNAVALDNLSGGEGRDFCLGSGFKLLCLSAYYSHKNLEIVLPVARLLRDRDIGAQIILTIGAEQHPAAKQLLDAIAREDLAAHVHNVGPVAMTEVPSLYQHTDALFLPTLLESFSGTYVEAMFHRRPILTSDFAFAHGVCGDAAIYVDPHDPAAIVDAIALLKDDAALQVDLARRGEARLATMADWPATTEHIVGIIDRLLANAERRAGP